MKEKISIFLILILLLMLNGCEAQGKQYNNLENTNKNENIDQIKSKIAASRKNSDKIKQSIEDSKLEEVMDTIETRIKVPNGFERIEISEDSFANYLRNLPLKQKGSTVHYYDGTEKSADGIYTDVINIDIGKANLQQCADAIMRLRSEYLLKENRDDEISFNLTNGFKVPYSKWKEGYRVVVENNESYWILAALPTDTYEEFKVYMEFIFNYAGTLSLSKELFSKDLKDMDIGDVFIKGGSPGHAILVADMVINKKTNEKKYLLIQSYMPAQDIQLLINPNSKEESVWYDLVDIEKIKTPEWTFESNQLKSFSKQN